MQPTSSTKHSHVISLLNDGYSLNKIEAKTCLGKSTIGRIKKEIYVDKENRKGGHPSKVSYHDKQSIIFQITTGKLDNAVQTTHYISNTSPTLSHPRKSEMHPRRTTSTLLSRKKAPSSRRVID